MPQIKIINTEIQAETSVITGFNGDAVPLDGALTYAAQCVVDVNTPSAKTFDSGAANVSDATTVADEGVLEVSDVACVADTGAVEVQTITMPATAGATQADYIVLANAAGVTYAFWIDIDDAGTAPTGAAYVAATNKIRLDCAAAGTAADNGAILTTAAAAMANVTILDNLDGTVTFTQDLMGNTANPDPHNANDSGAGSISGVVDDAGAASNLNSTYFNYETKNLGGATVNLRYGWFSVNGEGVDPAPASRTGIEIPITLGAQADTDVAAASRTALAADTDVTITGATNHCIITNNYMGNVTNAANGTASPGFSYVITPGVASNLNSSYMTFAETADAVKYAAWFNINGEGTDPAVAGYTSIEVTEDLSATADEIATAGRAAIDAAIGAAIVVSGATNHIILTNSTRGVCEATANGAVSPGFTIDNDPVGTDVEVDTTDNEITIPSHGLTTGLKGQLTTTGTLPDPLLTATDYFVIVIDADTIQLATTLANALAGTEIDITDTGADNSVNTFTATSIAGGTVKLQMSNDDLNAAPVNWSDEGSSTNITADANVMLKKVNPEGNWMRLVFAITAGQFDVSSTIVVKGPN